MMLSDTLDDQKQKEIFDFFNSPFNFLSLNKKRYEYQDVLISPRSGCVFDLKGEPILETLHDFLYWNPSTLNLNLPQECLNREIQKRKDLIRPFQEKVVQDLEQNQLLNLGDRITGIHLLSGFGWYPFGHFFDYLQKLFVIQNRKYSSPLFLHSRSYAVRNFAEHFNACGVSNDMLFECRHDFPTIFVKKLIYISPFIPTKLTPETAQWISDTYINHFVQNSERALQKNSNNEERFCLFLDRHHVRPGYRSISNYSEVMKWVNFNNFKVMNGDESLAEIVFYFSKAKFIFGAHGGLFLNTVFAPKDCCIFEFSSNKRINKCFFLQPINCQNYSFIELDSDEKNNISLDIEQIESYFRGSIE